MSSTENILVVFLKMSLKRCVKTCTHFALGYNRIDCRTLLKYLSELQTYFQVGTRRIMGVFYRVNR